MGGMEGDLARWWKEICKWVVLLASARAARVLLVKQGNDTPHRWLRTGDEAVAAMLGAIRAARESVRLETYIFAASPVGERFLAALVEARKRGARVQVLVDALGSSDLERRFWEPLTDAGGEFRWFNPVQMFRVTIRNHRKSLVCDERVAIIGGFNIAPEYEGDGVERGWCDHGMELRGPLARELAAAFDESFVRAEFRQQLFARLRKTEVKRCVSTPDGDLLLTGPGRGRNPIRRLMGQDIRRARDVRIASAYFSPTWVLRHELAGVVKRGGRVQLLMAGKSDVPISQLACRGLYQGLLGAGVEIYEYQPQILHAKLFIVDDSAYVGSANLDARSLNINYEFLVRVRDPGVADGARAIFAEDLKHAQRIDPATWRRSRSVWEKLKERFAHFVVARLDPRIARMQMRDLR